MHPRRVPGAASSLNAESSTRKRSSSMLFKPTSTSKKANTRRTSPVIDSNNALAPQRMTLEQTANAAASLMQFTQSLQPSQSQGTRESFARPHQRSQRHSNLSALERLQRNEKHAPKKLVTDPRNVKDPEVQRRYLRNITDYLQETNYKGTPPPQNIRALSNKNFEAIFKHLVARLMPSHRYKRKFEEDAMEILRFLNYALVETISAKSFLSIGALHSNPQFFGILHWLVECCKAKDIIPEPEEEEESLPSVNGQDGLSILFHEYALATYHVYMNGSDDYNEPNQELKEVFDVANESNIAEVEKLTARNKELKEQIEEAQSTGSVLARLKKKSQDLAKDTSKHQEFLDLRLKKNEKYEILNARVKEDQARLNREIASLEAEKAQIQTKLTEKGISPKELGELYEKHNQIQTEYANKSAAMEEAKKSLKEKNDKLIQMKQQLGREIEHYNLKVKDIPSTILEGKDIVIRYNPDGATAKEICGVDIESDILPVLESFQKKIQSELRKVTDETYTLRSKVEEIGILMEQQQKEIEFYENVVADIKRSYDEQHSIFIKEMKQHNALVDKHERAIDKRKSQARKTLLETKEELFKTQEKLKELSTVIDRTRAEVRKQIEPFLTRVKKTHNRLTVKAENVKKELQKH